MLEDQVSKTFQDDFLLNIRRGATPEMAVAELRDAYADVLHELEVRTKFAVSLAFIAWCKGCLYPALRDEACTMLKACPDHLLLERDRQRLNRLLFEPSPREERRADTVERPSALGAISAWLSSRLTVGLN